MTTLAERVKAARSACGMSQQALAVKADCWPTTVSRVENGQQEPSLELLSKLARALEVSVSQLIGEEEPQPAAAPSPPTSAA